MIGFPLFSPCSVLQVGKTYELLNCDKHKSMLLKNGRDPGEVRPDITHQVLVWAELMNDPLSKCCVSGFTVPFPLPFSELADAYGQPPEPSWLAPGLYPHTEECAH